MLAEEPLQILLELPGAGVADALTVILIVSLSVLEQYVGCVVSVATT